MWVCLLPFKVGNIFFKKGFCISSLYKSIASTACIDPVMGGNLAFNCPVQILNARHKGITGSNLWLLALLWTSYSRIMEWLLPVYFTVVHWSQRSVRIRGAALGRIISNVHIVLCTAFSCLPLTVPIRFPFHLGESIFLCSCFFMICLCCCIPVSQILYPSEYSCFRLLALLASAGCQLW